MGKTKLKTVEAVAEVKKDTTQPEAEEVVVAQEEPVVEKKKADPAAKKTKASKASKKKGNLKERSKKYQAAIEQIERVKRYPVQEAVELSQKTSYTKFEGTIEAHLNTAQKNLRGLINLPHLSGKKLKIIAFGKGAEGSGADLVGSDETLEEIAKGKYNFDVMIATPEWMPKLAKAAKFLGPRGLMPNPKNNTVTDDLAKAVTELQSGKVEYKTEKDAQVIHLAIGKVSQPSEEIVANLKALYLGIGKSRIRKVTLAATMGPGIKIDLSSL